jgi:hypothetical protein
MPVLQNLGFQMVPEYKFARMANHRQLLRTMRAWRDAGFKVDKATSTVLKDVFDRFKASPGNIEKFGFSTKLEFRNFYREEIKPSASPTDLKVYPQIQDGQMYLILPMRGQTANIKAARVPVTNVKWRDGGGANEVMCHLQSKEQGKQVLKSILERGIKIDNMDELKSQYMGLKMGKKAGKGE